jgi:hypothetical protein
MIRRIRTTVQDRRIEIAAPDDVPDGAEVIVDLVASDEHLGLEESDWDDSPEGIEAWIDSVHQLQPLILRDDEVSEMKAAKASQKQWEKARFDQHADDLLKGWE